MSGRQVHPRSQQKIKIDFEEKTPSQGQDQWRNRTTPWRQQEQRRHPRDPMPENRMAAKLRFENDHDRQNPIQGKNSREAAREKCSRGASVFGNRTSRYQRNNKAANDEENIKATCAKALEMEKQALLRAGRVSSSHNRMRPDHQQRRHRAQPLHHVEFALREMRRSVLQLLGGCWKTLFRRHNFGVCS